MGAMQKSTSLNTANMKGLLAGMIRMMMSAILTKISEMNRA